MARTCVPLKFLSDVLVSIWPDAVPIPPVPTAKSSDHPSPLHEALCLAVERSVPPTPERRGRRGRRGDVPRGAMGGWASGWRCNSIYPKHVTNGWGFIDLTKGSELVSARLPLGICLRCWGVSCVSALDVNKRATPEIAVSCEFMAFPHPRK